jgi:hypothetical protein
VELFYQDAGVLCMSETEGLTPQDMAIVQNGVPVLFLLVCIETHLWYPLVNVNITIENHHFKWENPL